MTGENTKIAGIPLAIIISAALIYYYWTGIRRNKLEIKKLEKELELSKNNQ
jgi:hypothetical protein